MKRMLVLAGISFSAFTLLTGCLAVKLGGGTTSNPQTPTVGQQLMDLQHAKDTGAITDDEFKAQKAKILGE